MLKSDNYTCLASCTHCTLHWAFNMYTRRVYDQRAFNDIVLWAAPPGCPSSYPCVDCGLMTGNFCDGGITTEYDQCYSADRVPKDYPADVYGCMRTPLCSYCETCFDYCRFCRGVSSCMPARRTRHWSGVPQDESREFTPQRAQIAQEQLIQSRAANEQRDATQAQRSAH